MNPAKGEDVLAAVTGHLGECDLVSHVNAGDLQGRFLQGRAKGVIATVAGNGTPGFSGDNGPAASPKLGPSAVAVDSAGNIYFAANGRIRKSFGHTDLAVYLNATSTMLLACPSTVMVRGSWPRPLSMGGRYRFTWSRPAIPCAPAYCTGAFTFPTVA
jgi:hypothetical protein